jgi:hypothetical protein
MGDGLAHQTPRRRLDWVRATAWVKETAVEEEQTVKFTNLIPFRRRRIPSRQVVADFTRVAKDQGMDLDYDRGKRLYDLLSDNSAPDQDRLDEIDKLLKE